jgi:hypothetical protein
MHKLLPSTDDGLLFFGLDGEAAERHGQIGCLRADFGRSGNEFFTTWFDRQAFLKTDGFKKEFDEVMTALRGGGENPPFASRENLAAFCAATPGLDLTTRGSGYTVRTEAFSHYFRCFPRPQDYDIYCFAYDNRYLLPELAGQHAMPRYCFSVLPSTGEMIRIVYGEAGYFRCNSAGLSPGTIRFKVDDENGLRHISRAQEEAMLAGSLDGWDSPAAKPWKYDMDGTPRLPKTKPPQGRER